MFFSCFRATKTSTSTPKAETLTNKTKQAKICPDSMAPGLTTEEQRMQRLIHLEKGLDVGFALNLAESVERLRLDYMCNRRNLYQIEDNLFLGRNRAALDPHLLETFSIMHMVNCARDCKRVSSHHALFGYVHIKAKDNRHERLAPYFEQTSAFIEDTIANGGKVLVHCYGGISRSTTILVAYLMAKRRMTLPVAFNFVKDKRSIARPIVAFSAELR
jgi:hypothetical protein